MFTGLVKDIGVLKQIVRRADYRVLTIASPLADDSMKAGDSVCCDGACLTVLSPQAGSFFVEASQETVERTIINKYAGGCSINLELALRVGDRLGGHFVAGHIDGRATVTSLKAAGDSLLLQVRYDQEFENLVIEKGSIAINGVSLTINEYKGGMLSLNLIPHTARNTNLAALKPGDEVNVEFDMIGKFVSRAKSVGDEQLSINRLIESGW